MSDALQDESSEKVIVYAQHGKAKWQATMTVVLWRLFPAARTPAYGMCCRRRDGDCCSRSPRPPPAVLTQEAYTLETARTLHVRTTAVFVFRCIAPDTVPSTLHT